MFKLYFTTDSLLNFIVSRWDMGIRTLYAYLCQSSFNLKFIRAGDSSQSTWLALCLASTASASIYMVHIFTRPLLLAEGGSMAPGRDVPLNLCGEAGRQAGREREGGWMKVSLVTAICIYNFANFETSRAYI